MAYYTGNIQAMNIQILFHSSKTMRIPDDSRRPLSTPRLLAQAEELVDV